MDRGHDGDRRSLEAGNFPKLGSEVIDEKRVAKKLAALGIPRSAVQNEMRGILAWMTTGAARRILNSANFREIRI